jgi:hypothetical protein
MYKDSKYSTKSNELKAKFTETTLLLLDNIAHHAKLNTKFSYNQSPYD